MSDNICQCTAGYAEGECHKHGLPIIHTITDDTYCPACRISEIKLAKIKPLATNEDGCLCPNCLKQMHIDTPKPNDIIECVHCGHTTLIE